jgi:linoleoyl-CoA desaturase
MSQLLKFSGNQHKTFFAEVRSRVDDYFKTNAISKNANGLMVFKTVLFLSLLVITYLTIMLSGLPGYVLLIVAMLLGTVKAFIGFNVCHDAIHGSYSSNQNVNMVLGWVFNLVGANDYMWKITHNQVHHTYTNIPGYDEDIEVAPGLVRLSPETEYKPWMKFQKYYAFLLYGLASLSWVVRKDFKKFFQTNIGKQDNRRHPKIELPKMIFFKILYFTLFLVLPIMYLPFSWYAVVGGFVLMHLAEGFVLGLVFQLAHVVEGMDFPEPTDEGVIEETWAVHQMRTTANFAMKSKIAAFFCGGLNFQVEHHLFPMICHVHYPDIAPIVKKTAEDFGVPYHHNETFMQAIGSHFRMLDRFGKESAFSENKSAVVA